ncbi:MAG: GAF domain-containing sensor histidine kinase [Patescibacteria group bacterium]
MADQLSSSKKSVFTTKRKRLEQDLEHITQEMYKRNLELAEINKMLSLLRAIDGLVLESQDSLQVLCSDICKAIVESKEYLFVSIFTKSPHHDKVDFAALNSIAGLPDQLRSDLSRMFVEGDNSWLAGGQTSTLLNLTPTITIKHINQLLNTDNFVIEELVKAIPAKSIYFVKLSARKRLVGVMAIGFSESLGELGAKDKAFMDRVSEAIGIAVDNKLLLLENEHVLRALKHSNEKLKALDEAKDEFISMASHQLRTPLTSMKGYVSMVLEGDAGKVSSMQRRLLDQAFVSSQRMVYLIADLLNVSRLRTGKFIIETKPTNLAKIVEEEISQLYETAKGRNLELTFNKPKNFPDLMLDETKIRQVVMNFTDNAIYYTPSGGHIKVIVEDKGESVEMRVEDDGLGVPKAEQHHLFSKFYRAGNAKKARPDGTGLGLFMAKKVVVAQGGNIIFHSQEGKGSIFGFSFAKTKLSPEAVESPK